MADPISTAIVGVSTGASIFGSLFGGSKRRSESRRVRQQLQQEFILSKKLQRQQEQLGDVQIANIMGSNLASRISGALEFSGSNAEVFTQERRNLEFSLANQLFQYDVQQMNIKNQQAAGKRTESFQTFQSLLGATSSLLGGVGQFSGAFGGGSRSNLSGTGGALPFFDLATDISEGLY